MVFAVKEGSAASAAVGRELVAAGRLRVITLPNARQRQESILRWCGLHGIGEEIFHTGCGPLPLEPPSDPSLTSKPPTSNPLTRRRYGRDQLQLAERGCLRSHRTLYRSISSRNCSSALILEDDVEPRLDGWPELVDALIRTIERSALRHLPWVCHLGLSPDIHRRLSLRRVRWRDPIDRGVVVPGLGQLDPALGSIWTTHAYLISNRAATAILEREPPDTYVADDWAIRLERGLIGPMLASMEPIFSPNPRLASQIPSRTSFVPGIAPLPSLGAQAEGMAHRLNRKALTVLYRAGLYGVTY